MRQEAVRKANLMDDDDLLTDRQADRTRTRKEM